MEACWPEVYPWESHQCYIFPTPLNNSKWTFHFLIIYKQISCNTVKMLVKKLKSAWKPKLKPRIIINTRLGTQLALPGLWTYIHDEINPLNFLKVGEIKIWDKSVGPFQHFQHFWCHFSVTYVFMFLLWK